MKASKILREAARLVEGGGKTAGCFAIVGAANALSDCKDMGLVRAMDVFANHFSRSTASGFWWPYEPAHGPRIIGLCLAAAIAESEGD